MLREHSRENTFFIRTKCHGASKNASTSTRQMNLAFEFFRWWSRGRVINREDEVIKETAKTYVYPARLDTEQRKFISIGHGRATRVRSPNFPAVQFVFHIFGLKLSAKFSLKSTIIYFYSC